MPLLSLCCSTAPRPAFFKNLSVLGLALFTHAALAQKAPQSAPAGHPLAVQFQIAAQNQVASRIDLTRRVPINGVLHSALATATDNGALPADAPLDHLQLQLNRPAARQAALDQLIDALHTPGSSSFHQWLTPTQVGQNFGPSQSDIDSLTGWLQSQGFTINMVSPGGLSIDFTGTHAQFAATFGTDFHKITLANGEVHTSVLSDPQIPDAFATLVPGFVSLSDIGPRSTLVHTTPTVAQKAYANGVSPMYTTSGPNYNMSPQDFYTIYNENSLLSAGTPINGSGRTIGIVAASNIVTNDVAAFRGNFGVSPATPASLTLQHGSTSVSCTDPGITASEDEVILDTEWAGSVAPSAALLVMSCASGGGYNGIQRAAMAMIDDNLVDIIDVSYGFYEAGLTSAGVAYYSNLWEQAAAEGITVVVSAGDSGAATQDQNATSATHGINVNGIGSSNYNVSAGGTDFMDKFNSGFATTYAQPAFWNASNTGTGSSAKSYVPETAWNATCASSLISYYTTGNSTDPDQKCNLGNGFQTPSGGGGGISIYIAKPSWQSITLLGLPTATTNRMMPDVSLFASAGPWSHAIEYYQSDASAGLLTAGGTSFVAPQLAGVFALVAQKTGGRLGQPNYILYNMAAVEYNNSTTLNACNGSGTTVNNGPTSQGVPASTCIFNDVTTGNISQGCTAGTPNCYTEGASTYGILSATGGSNGSGSDVAIYPATQGWDYATGLGSINITNLVNQWQTAISGGTTYTPTITLTPASLSATYGTSASASLVATVSGSGSFPTGNVLFSGSGAIGAIGNVSLVASSGCSSGGTCTETATQAYTSASFLVPGTYVITSNYNIPNENYAAASTSFNFIVSKQTPTLSIGATTTVTYGSNSTFTASLAYTGAGAAPTGAVTFSVDGGSALTATCTGSSSPLSCTYTGGISAGASHTLNASYAGDGNYNSATATQTTFVVSKQTATLVIAATPTFNYGHSSTLTANLSWSAGSAPTSAGTINFSIDGSGPLGASCTVSTSPITCTFTFGFTGGTHTIDASFAGDTNFSAATATQSSFTVNKQSPTPSANTITTVTYGSNSSLSGTVSYTGNGVAPTGAVTFSVDSGSALTATCTGSSSPLSCTYSGPFSAGSHTTTMSVAADTNYNATTIPGNGFTVNKQTPTLVIAATSTVTYGSSSHLSANLSWSAGSAPTSAGPINFSIDGSGPLGASCTGSTSPITCTFTFAFTGGTHTVDASFSGDTNFNAASATQSSFTVNKASSTTSVHANPSSPSSFGDSVQFTAVIPGTSPTGTATFFDGGTPISGSLTISAGAPIHEPNTLSVHPQTVGRTATFTTTSLSAGTHSITATYSGDTNFTGSTSSSISFTVNKATPTITWVPSALSVYSGKPIGSSVLDAIGSVPATITYTATPSGGSASAATASTVLAVNTYTLTATLTPTDAADYNNATSTVAFTVNVQNIWIVNSNGTLSAVNDGGGAVSSSSGYSGGGTAASAVALDGSGNVWSLNSANNAVVEYSNTGTAISTSPGFTGGGINAPTALAIDGNGTAWVTNANGSVSAVASPGFTLTPSAGYTGGNMSSPTGIAVDSSGNLWISNGNNSITEIIGTAAPVVSPTSVAVKTNSLGVRP